MPIHSVKVLEFIVLELLFIIIHILMICKLSHTWLLYTREDPIQSVKVLELLVGNLYNDITATSLYCSPKLLR